MKKTFIIIALCLGVAFAKAQDSVYCYNSGAAITPAEEFTEAQEAKISLGQNSIILMPYVMKEKEVMLIIKEKNDATLNKLVRKLKLADNLQPIGFVAVPAGLLSGISFIGASSPDLNKNNNRLTQQCIGIGFFALGAVCLSSSFYFKIQSRKNYKKAIVKYNQLYN